MPFTQGMEVLYTPTGKGILRSMAKKGFTGFPNPKIRTEKFYPAKVIEESPVKIQFTAEEPEGHATKQFSSDQAEDALLAAGTTINSIIMNANPTKSGGKRKSKKTRKQTRKAKKGTYRKRR